jgi:DNA helicase-2/ATP-dependent DNA helicase PcrA
MQYFNESSVNINDDILQRELSSTSDEKMKNIVATIQKEQNVVIRNDTSQVLVIQGVAGSGKTSIALHRVAFLLYRHKDTLTSRNVLIVSPNKVFADYISNVLPELGEEEIAEVGFEEIAAHIIGRQYRFERFAGQVSGLLDNADADAVRRIRFKAGTDFVRRLDAFIARADTEFFVPQDTRIGLAGVPKETLLNIYRAYQKMPVRVRLETMAEELIERSREEGQRPDAASCRQFRAAIKKMFRYPDAISFYKGFYEALKMPEMFVFKSAGTFEYADVFPFVYVKLHFEGAAGYEAVKHLLVDEMQDYTPIQYAVLRKLFSCKMTILGDSNQSVNPYSASTGAQICEIFPRADYVELCKSYRSTFEITRFAQSIQKNEKLIPIERHGEEPTVTNCSGTDGEIDRLYEIIDAFLKSNYRSLGIICKTQAQAQSVFDALKGRVARLHLLGFESREFMEGILVTSAHMAKGLEFDQVAVPFADAENYRNELDRSMLYVACTRAMHRLDLTYSRKASVFLPAAHA